MRRTKINPWDWSLKFGYSQGEVLENVTKQLNCAGQTAVDAEGNPQCINDMRGQIKLALENLKAVLVAASMSYEDVTKLTIYVTDMDAARQHFDLLGMKLGQANNLPAMTLLGVSRLALPELMVEIEAVAAV